MHVLDTLSYMKDKEWDSGLLTAASYKNKVHESHCKASYNYLNEKPCKTLLIRTIIRVFLFDEVHFSHELNVDVKYGRVIRNLNSYTLFFLNLH